MPAHSLTYGYARVSKSDEEARNLETQVRLLDDHGVRPNLVYQHVASGRSLARSGWQDLMEVVRPGDTIAVAFLDRLSRNFEEGVRLQTELLERDVAIRESIDTRDSTAAGKYFRRAMLALGAYQVDATSERIRDGQARARGEGRRSGRPPTLSPEQVEQCQRMAEKGAGLRHIARVMQCSPATIKKALYPE